MGRNNSYAAATVKKGLEIGKELGARSYVFRGGRQEQIKAILNQYLVEF